MRSYLSGSLVFRLWLALSVVATVFTSIALVTYTWLAIDDDLDAAHAQSEARVQGIQARIARIQLDAIPLSEQEIATSHALGLVTAEVLAPTGAVLNAVDFVGRDVTPLPLDPAALVEGDLPRRFVRIESDIAKPASLTPLTALFGGEFGEESIVQLTQTDEGRTGYLRALIVYPGLAAEARAKAVRSAFAGILIIGTILGGMWPLLKLFVAKPLRHYSELAGRIANGEPVRMPVQDRGELGELARAVNAMADTLEHEATLDALTGLYNLRHLGANLEPLIASAVKDGQSLSLIMADLDNLKPVNDTLGHQAGDQILRSVSASIKAWGRPTCTCWRLGGDEFVILVPGASPEEGVARVDELKQLVASLIVDIDNTLVRPSVSVGIAHCPIDGTTAGELIGVADRRMYEAKAQRSELKRLQLVS